jgi:uncharacterized membrane protein YidH (DUF202 family)
VTALGTAYLALGGGLTAFGAILVWQALRRQAGPSSWPLRAAMAVALVVAVAGMVAAVILEARATRPF